MSDSRLSAAAPPTSAAPPRELEGRSAHNFSVLALHGAITRIGWIFKTESVLIPAFLDAIGGSGALRGVLPLANRLGQSVLPFLLARRLKTTPRKRSALALASLGQAATFGLLAGIVAFGVSSGLGTIVGFLVLYTAFFAFTGLMQLALGTLTGKLVRADRRGRLLSVSTVVGVVPAAALAWWLLPGWLEGPTGPRWPLIFGTTAGLFGLAAFCAWGLREPPDDYHEAPSPVHAQVRDALALLRRDRNLGLLLGVGVLFNTSIMAFPHYQAFAREELGLAGSNLMLWVVAQNLAMGVASLAIGPLADRYGNRRVLTGLCFGTMTIPAFVLVLGELEPDVARWLFPLVFVGNGLVPNGLRILSHYTLEICSEADHPRYLSLLQLATASAFVLSPLLGYALDRVGFSVVLAGVAVLGLAAALLSFGLHEPRVTDRSRD